MSKRAYYTKDNALFCPKCGSSRLTGIAEQCCEDGCEMWFECAECGWEHESRERVETVMGWNDAYIGDALLIWKEGILAFAGKEG